MPDWVTISSLATAGGTLVLAVATFSAVRSSNRSARVAEQALAEQRRPVLVNARLDDPMQKVMFVDGRWLRAEGSEAVIDEDAGTIFLALPVRNIGSGIAVVQGWYPWPDLKRSEVEHRPPEEFRRQVRHIYVAPGDVGMWQGALREASDDLTRSLDAVRAERKPFTIDLLYSDQFGGQRAISRFAVTPAGDDRWLGNIGFHWDLPVATPAEVESTTSAVSAPLRSR